jgi:hypothetical protein
MKVSLPRKFDNADPSVQALLDDPQLLGGRPSTPSLRTRQNSNRGLPDAYDDSISDAKLFAVGTLNTERPPPHKSVHVVLFNGSLTVTNA